MEKSQEHRINLRLPTDLMEAMDELRIVGEGCASVNKWVLDAIQEKIGRDSQSDTLTKTKVVTKKPKFYEFFAGGGMARAGLGDSWECLFSNDFSAMKGQVYKRNWNGGSELLIEDVNKVSLEDLPNNADLVWASFPCQDLSLAGNSSGLGHRDKKDQTRSGTFWPFWKLMRGLMDAGRAPSIIVLENVYGALTSHEGKDFAAIGSAFSGANYKFGALVIDAKHFVPQSRQRVFIVGVRNGLALPKHLTSSIPSGPWHPEALQRAHKKLSQEAQRKWIWWNVPAPAKRTTRFVDLVEENPSDVSWHSAEETKRLLSLMNEVNLEKVEEAKRAGVLTVGALYRRTRQEEDGEKRQRAEVRFDDIAGCLRTPSGGSSRQIILIVDGNKVRSRLLSPREAARLMGLDDSYVLPKKYNDAYHVAGDGVVVPVVSHLSKHLFKPILDS